MTSKEIAQVLRDDAEQLSLEAKALKRAANTLDPRGGRRPNAPKSAVAAGQGPEERAQGDP